LAEARMTLANVERTAGDVASSSFFKKYAQIFFFLDLALSKRYIA
jgi:hypothetical protein